MRVGFGGLWWDGHSSRDNSVFFASVVVDELFMADDRDNAQQFLNEAISVLQPGDVLVVPSLCCMGDTPSDVIAALALTGEKGADVEIGELNGIDQGLSGEMLLLVAKYLFSFKPCFEEKKRKKEVATAWRRPGRPKLLTDTAISDISALLSQRTESVRKLAEQHGVSVTTIYRLRRLQTFRDGK